jgi:NAD(P)H-flavin reductase
VTDDLRFRPARLAGRESAGGGLTRVKVEPEPGSLASYRNPGQYVEMRAGQETGFFVISSEPGVGPWELVMRSGGGASDVVLAMPIGSAIELTWAIGDGFPMADAAGSPLVVALNGTGVAAGPPVVRRRVRDGDAAITHVFLGVRAPDEVPIEPELRQWQRQGVEVIVCLSQTGPGPVHEGARMGSSSIVFSPGYVQEVVRARLAAQGRSGLSGLGGARVFAVGSSSMVDALRAMAPDLGLDGGRVHTNY